MNGERLDRRTFLKTASSAALGLGLSGSLRRLEGAKPVRPVRLGFVGTGNRGTGLLETMIAVGGVEIPAICDINQAHIQRAALVVEERLGRKPELYDRGPEDYRRLCDRDDLDAVMTATPWETAKLIASSSLDDGLVTNP